MSFLVSCLNWSIKPSKKMTVARFKDFPQFLSCYESSATVSPNYSFHIIIVEHVYTFACKVDNFIM